MKNHDKICWIKTYSCLIDKSGKNKKAKCRKTCAIKSKLEKRINYPEKTKLI